jgi:hypothetical protein
MFYEEEKINELLRCEQCQKRYVQPRSLPCGECICTSCLEKLIQEQSSYSNAKLKCCYCLKEHDIPIDGFPVSKKIEKMLAMNSNEIYRGKAAEELKTHLRNIKNEIDDMECILENRTEKIKQRCSFLKHQILIKAESLVCQINQLSDEMQQEIDKYEIECIESFEENKEIKQRTIKAVSEGKAFYEPSNKYLAQFKINEQEVERLVEKSKRTLYNCKITKIAIFSKKYFEFEDNEKQLDSSSIGWIRKIASFLDSTILSEEQQTDLIKLCKFDSYSKWSLLYRASRDGRTAHAFHSNCDNKAKTLTVVKSTDNELFGAYTEKAWSSNNQSKLDPNAFLFSLANRSSTPVLIWRSIKNNKSIYCHANYGPTFIDTSKDTDSPELLISFDNDNYESYFGWALQLKTSRLSHYLRHKEEFSFIDFEVFQQVS